MHSHWTRLKRYQPKPTPIRKPKHNKFPHLAAIANINTQNAKNIPVQQYMHLYQELICIYIENWNSYDRARKISAICPSISASSSLINESIPQTQPQFPSNFLLKSTIYKTTAQCRSSKSRESTNSNRKSPIRIKYRTWIGIWISRSDTRNAGLVCADPIET